MSDSIPRYTSTAEGFRDAKEIAALRPMAEPKPRAPRKARREPMARSRTFFCSNPQCDHDTWSPVEQAQHMAREFWQVAQALVRLAPESPEALKLTGGVILRDLTDDECRKFNAEWNRDLRADRPSSTIVYLGYYEYTRRQQNGLLSRAVKPVRHVDPAGKCRNGHLYTPENTRIEDGSRCCLTCKRASQARRNARFRARHHERLNAARRKPKVDDDR